MVSQEVYLHFLNFALYTCFFWKIGLPLFFQVQCSRKMFFFHNAYIYIYLKMEKILRKIYLVNNINLFFKNKYKKILFSKSHEMTYLCVCKLIFMCTHFTYVYVSWFLFLYARTACNLKHFFFFHRFLHKGKKFGFIFVFIFFKDLNIMLLYADNIRVKTNLSLIC